MNDLIAKMKDVMTAITKDIDKDNKSAEARVRKNTLEFAKLSKQYRKDSIERRK